MSDRDELAADIRRVDGKHDLGAGALSDVLWAAGWRKKPERDAMARAIFELQYHSTHWWDAKEPEKNDYRNRADRILALMDGPTETEGDTK